MAEIIKFPKTPKEKISKNAEAALRLEAQKKRTEINLNLIIGGSGWDMITLTHDYM